MWTIDYVLQLASLGYNSAYIHTREAGVSYNLFDPPAPGLDQNIPGWTTGPPYHALLVVAEALHIDNANGMAVVDLNVPSPSNTVAGYALYPSGSSSQPPARLVLFNFANDTATFKFAQNYTAIPANGVNVTIGNVAIKYLSASSITSSLNITWGGQVVDGGGNLQGDVDNTTLSACGTEAGCLIAVPGPSVALVYLDGTAAATNTGSTATTGSSNGTSTTTGVNSPASESTVTFLLPAGGAMSKIAWSSHFVLFALALVWGSLLVL